ncbi:MAG TPA: hypothetical protein PJ991_04520 [Kiritimatiellia bacterium]|nr:hypothetical protein [Kiritimatiellia bacterium]
MMANARRRSVVWIELVLVILAGQGLVAASAADPRLTYELVGPTPEEISRLSEIGRDVLRRADKWHVGRSDNFYVFAGTPSELTSMIGQAELAHRRIGQALMLETRSTNRAYVISVTNNRQWRRLVGRYGVRRDGLAMHIGRELYMKDDKDQARRPDRVAHEVIHLRLSDAFSGHIPLWLDEGLAEYYGWLFAVEYHSRRDVLLFRNFPPLEERDLIPSGKFFVMNEYPLSEKNVKAFYRQADEMIGILSGHFLPGDWKTFLSIMTDASIAVADRLPRALSAMSLEMEAVLKEWKSRCLAARRS